jgi:hypothetical protein
LTASFSSTCIVLFFVENFGVIGWIELAIEFDSIHGRVALTYFIDGQVCTILAKCYTVQDMLVVIQKIRHPAIVTIPFKPIRVFVHLQAPQ